MIQRPVPDQPLSVESASYPVQTEYLPSVLPRCEASSHCQPGQRLDGFQRGCCSTASAEDASHASAQRWPAMTVKGSSEVSASCHGGELVECC